MSTEGKVIKCMAAVLWAPKTDLVVEEVEVAPPKAGEVRVKYIAAGICHSDLHAMDGEHRPPLMPVILGHEAAGIVESIGEGITSFQPGDKVIPCFLPQCNDCNVCKRPDANACDKAWANWYRNMDDGTSRFTCRGKSVFHFVGTSCFSQYAVVPQESITMIPQAAPLDRVCLLSCGFPTGYGSAVNLAKVKQGSTCAVWGLGTIGLSAVMGCKANGAARIIGIDTNPDKEEVGRKFGITEFVNPKDHTEPIQEVIKKMTDGGCDYTIEAIGNKVTMRAAFEACHVSWGKCVVAGIVPLQDMIEVDPLQIVCGKTLTGGVFGGFKPKEAIPGLVEDYLNKKLNIDGLITKTMPLKDINTAIKLLQEGKVLRTVINMFD